MLGLTKRVLRAATSFVVVSVASSALDVSEDVDPVASGSAPVPTRLVSDAAALEVDNSELEDADCGGKTSEAAWPEAVSVSELVAPS